MFEPYPWLLFEIWCVYNSREAVCIHNIWLKLAIHFFNKSTIQCITLWTKSLVGGYPTLFIDYLHMLPSDHCMHIRSQKEAMYLVRTCFEVIFSAQFWSERDGSKIFKLHEYTSQWEVIHSEYYEQIRSQKEAINIVQTWSKAQKNNLLIISDLAYVTHVCQNIFMEHRRFLGIFLGFTRFKWW